VDLNEDMTARIAEQRERLAAAKAGVARARTELDEASTTARSKDRSVEVTVGSQGELKRVKFLEEKYRTMEPGELSAAIVEAANKGRAVMADRVRETFSSIAPARSADSDVPGFSLDWEQLFGTAPKTDGRRSGRPAAALHDEIVEDDGDV
jgi:DNA-binding protein YbaB